jgi:predicted ArsR family transcriptional regulator
VEPPTPDQPVARIAALDQPLRRDLYRLLRAADGWTSRDDAAAALGIPRSVAAFHLDKLADVGVLETRFERTSGRQGPGAGRPSKLYRPSHDDVVASVPTRHYDLAGSLLAAAIDESTRGGRPVAACRAGVARTAGRLLGEEASDAVRTASRAADRRQVVVEVLARHGYEPTLGRHQEIVLANCPFHRLAEAHRDLICGMNLDFLAGLLEGMGPDMGLTARLEPAPGSCCVRIRA